VPFPPPAHNLAQRPNRLRCAAFQKWFSYQNGCFTSLETSALLKISKNAIFDLAKTNGRTMMQMYR
jgi:hypothetical protein